MKKSIKIVIPIVFALVGTSFVAYSFLDTFVIPKEYKNVFKAENGASNFSFSFADMNKSSSSSSSSSKPSSSTSAVSSSSSISSTSAESSTSTPEPNEYYEDLTPEEIDALFTKEVVFEPKKHYSDPDIYVDITTDRYKDHSTYYLADIRIRNASYLKTALAKDKAGENITEFTSEMCKRHKGIIAIDGDTYGAQNSGYVLRNGQVIRSSRNTGKGKGTDLAIYADGTFEIFNEKDYTLNEIAAKGAWQVFSFGPALVDKGERVIDKGVEVETAASQNRNQRCAIGMVAPLHYVFVVSDGRIASSPGLSLYQIGRILEINHCYVGYNLDGGGSATMYFDDGTGDANGNGALVNYCTQQLVQGSTLPESPPIGERGVSDCVYIGKE